MCVNIHTRTSHTCWFDLVIPNECYSNRRVLKLSHAYSRLQCTTHAYIVVTISEPYLTVS